jgi:hypothetical protein
MKNLRIHSCADNKDFFVEIQTNETVKCAFDLTKSCYSTCAACELRGYVFCTRGSGSKDEFCIGIIP